MKFGSLQQGAVKSNKDLRPKYMLTMLQFHQPHKSCQKWQKKTYTLTDYRQYCNSWFSITVLQKVDGTVPTYWSIFGPLTNPPTFWYRLAPSFFTIRYPVRHEHLLPKTKRKKNNLAKLIQISPIRGFPFLFATVM